MFDVNTLKIWSHWAYLRIQICTAAVAFCFNSTWRVPRDAFRYGGVAYGVVFTIAMVTVALPIALFQLSVGQLSQQDPVGIWRAVPFFKGVGYLRLLLTFLVCVYTVTYLGITTTLFFYSVNTNSAPFWKCWDISFNNETNNDSYVYNITTCVNGSLLPPLHEQPESYIAMSLITLVLWVLFPIILYKPAKIMKKILYGTLPLVLVLAVTILSYLADKNGIGYMFQESDWLHLERPEIWYAATSQVLWSSQIAGGYLITVGGTVYSSTDVHWTTITFISLNILASWFGLMFWYAIGGTDLMDTSVLAVLAQTYIFVQEKQLSVVWLPVIFAVLFLSGVVTVVILLYPLYERLRRIGGVRWRYLAAGSSVAGAGAALAALAGGLPALSVLDDVVVPFLASITTILEICPFIFIYGGRVLIEDIEFLVGRDVTKYWVWWWCAAIGIIFCCSAWWLLYNILGSRWVESKWVTSGLLAAASVTLAIFLAFAIISIARQVHYDFIGKLKSSFKPSRHWGPRDPITHYYWRARREDIQADQPRSRYHRRQLGQFSGNSSFLNINNNLDIVKETPDGKKRSNSDDWIYTNRKKYFTEMYREYKLRNKKRSMSLDWTIILKYQANNTNNKTVEPLDK